MSHNNPEMIDFQVSQTVPPLSVYSAGLEYKYFKRCLKSEIIRHYIYITLMQEQSSIFNMASSPREKGRNQSILNKQANCKLKSFPKQYPDPFHQKKGRSN